MAGVPDAAHGEDLRVRTKRFAVTVLRFLRGLPKTEEARILGKQLLRSATSVAANYRAAGRSRTTAEFLAKLGTVIEEADETTFWLELLVEAGIVDGTVAKPVLQEADQLLRIFVASRKTARHRYSRT